MITGNFTENRALRYGTNLNVIKALFAKNNVNIIEPDVIDEP